MQPQDHTMALALAGLSFLVSTLSAIVISLIAYFAKGHSEKLNQLEAEVNRHSVSIATCAAHHDAARDKSEDADSRITDLGKKIDAMRELLSDIKAELGVLIERVNAQK